MMIRTKVVRSLCRKEKMIIDNQITIERDEKRRVNTTGIKLTAGDGEREEKKDIPEFMTGVQRLLSIDEIPYGHFEYVYILLYYTSLFSP